MIVRVSTIDTRASDATIPAATAVPGHGLPDSQTAPAMRLFIMLREFVRYFGASACALALDAGLLALGRLVGLPYPLAAGIGFLAGLALAYWLSVRWVFTERSLENKVAEFGTFAIVGVAGLGLTELILHLGIEAMGWSLPVSKTVSAGIVFLFNFGLRKALLFRTHDQ